MPASAKSRIANALPGGSTGLGSSRNRKHEGTVDDLGSPQVHVSTTQFNPSIILTSYKPVHAERTATLPHSAGTASTSATKPRSPYLAKPSHLLLGEAYHPDKSNSPSSEQRNQHHNSIHDHQPPVKKRSSPPDSDPSPSSWSLEAIREDIRRLHHALTAQGAGASGPTAGAAARASGSGASGASMLKQSRDESCLARSSSTTSSNSASSSVGPGAGSSAAGNAGPPSAEGLGPELQAGCGGVEGQIEAAGASRGALLELLALKAAQLLRSGLSKLGSEPSMGTGAEEGAVVAGSGASGAGAGGGSGASVRPGTAVPKARAPAARPLPPRPASALPGGGGGTAITPSNSRAASASLPDPPTPTGACTRPPPAASSGAVCAPAMASALLEVVSLMGDLQRQATSKGTALRLAEEQTADVRTKLGLTQQDNTLLRNIVAELQAGSRPYSAFGSGDGGEVQRPSSARPAASAEVGCRPDAALLKKIQTLSKEVFDLKRQLEAASKKAQGLQEQLDASGRKMEEAAKKAREQREALQAQLDAARKALTASEGREREVTRERDRLSERCRKFESDLGHVTQKCDLLERERDQSQRQRRDAEDQLASQLATARAVGELRHAWCQTDVDPRDALLRDQTLELDDLRQRLAAAKQELYGTSSRAAAEQQDAARFSTQCEQLSQEREELMAKLEAAERASLEADEALREAEGKLVAGRTREQVLAAGAEKAAFEHRQARAALEQTLRERDEQIEALQASSSALEARLSELSLQRDAIASQLSELSFAHEALVSERGDLEAAKAEREERLQALERVLAQVQELERVLAARDQQVASLQRQLADSQGRWEAAQVDLDAERRRLEAEWQEVAALRTSLQQEASTIKAMGTLVQAKTLKFDLSGMVSVSSLGTGPGRGRPMSALPTAGGAGAGADGAGGPAAMRLGALVKELQEQLAIQGRQLVDQQRQVEDLQARLAREHGAHAAALAAATGPTSADHGDKGRAEELERQLSDERRARESAEARAVEDARKLQEAGSKSAEMERRLNECEARLSAATAAGNEALQRQADGHAEQLAALKAQLQAAQASEETAKGVNWELHKMCERVQRNLSTKTAECEQLQLQCRDHESSLTALRLQLDRSLVAAEALREQLDKQQLDSKSLRDQLEGQQTMQQVDLDYERLLQQLQATRANLAMCTEKLEGAERTIYQQDERIALLQSRVKALEDEADAATFASSLSGQSQGQLQGPGPLQQPSAGSFSASAFAGAGAGLRSALAGPASGSVGSAGTGMGPDARPLSTGSPSGAGPTVSRSGFVLRPSSASLVGRVMEHEGGGGYVPRAAGASMHHAVGTGAAPRAGAGSAGWQGGAANGRPMSAAVSSPSRPNAWADAQEPGRARASSSNSLPPAGLPRTGSPNPAYGAGASLYGQSNGSPLAAGGAAGSSSRPSTAVTRKTLVLLSTKASMGLDDGEGEGEWQVV